MEDGGFGPIAGSSPNWQHATFHDRGRTHLQHHSELSSTCGFKEWGSAPAPVDRPMRRQFEPSPQAQYGEPVVQNGHTSYYMRRTAVSEQPSYRRSLLPITDPGTLRVDRPEGKRSIPEPYGAPPEHRGRREAPPEALHREGHLAEPAMPRLGRPVGISGLRQSDQELSYERAMGRKIRVDHQSYVGQGRAGDLSTSFAPPRRPDDDSSFFKSLKDTPTFIRFCNTLPPKPAISPHERRAVENQRNQHQEVQRDRELVASLHLADPEEDV